ncbi:MAG TPA: phosphate regulon transcriptional regulator PhoB [Azospirillum sp.]
MRGTPLHPGLEPRPLVLVVEDERELVTLITYNLEREGFRVAVAFDGEDALLQVLERAPDVVLLDWMLPEVSGLEVCRRLRRTPKTAGVPIIMLTARGDERDRVHGLSAGADDYLVKPFSPAELAARIRSLLRRANSLPQDEVLAFENLTMDLAAHRVRRGGRSVHLGPTEYRMLRHFLMNPKRVYSRAQLLDVVWGNEVFVEPRTVDVHIRRLRKALNENGEADLIRTVRSTGYALDRQTGH